MSHPYGGQDGPLPSHTPHCMGCGPENPDGLGLVVYRRGVEVYSDVVFDQRHVGAPGLAHGGAIAAACDDVSGFILWVAGTPAVTRKLTVDYLLPVPLQQRQRITARILRREGRALHVTATGVDEGGVIHFTSQALFVVVDTDHFAAHGDVTVFDELLQRIQGDGADSGRETQP